MRWSPLYYLIVWAARVVGGNSEVVLRLPSLIAAAVSAVVLYRLARPLISREAARLTVLVFAAGQVAAFEASEARPYAMATLAVIASTYALVRWLDDGRRWSPALVYALLAITVVWMHYLFALVLVAHALYALIRLRRGETEVTVRRLAAVAVIVTAGIVPLAIQLASLWDRRSSLSIPSEASVRRIRDRAASARPGRVRVPRFAPRIDAGPRADRTGSRAVVDPRAPGRLAAVPRRHALPRVGADARRLPLAAVLRVRGAGYRAVRRLGDRVAGAGGGPADRRDRAGAS